MALNPEQKRALRAKAHLLSAVVQTGSKGLTDAVVAEADSSLNHHELMKVKIAGADREARAEITEQLAQRLAADIVSTIGGVVTLYRKAPPAKTKAKAKPKSRTKAKAKAPPRVKSPNKY